MESGNDSFELNLEGQVRFRNLKVGKSEEEHIKRITSNSDCLEC